MKSRHAPFLAAAIVALPLAVALSGSALAQAINKGTTGTDLTATGSWVGGVVPGSGNVATWVPGSLGGALTIGSDLSWQGIDIQGTTAAITTSGAGTLTLGSSGINLASSGVNLTLGNSRTAGDSQSWTVGSGRTLTLTGATTTFGTGTTTTLSGAGIVEIGGTQALTGSGNLVINGAQFNNNLQGGTQSRSGATTLNSGIIRISTSISMFGTGALNLNGGSIGSFNTTGRVIGTNAVNIGGNIQIGGSSPLSTGYIRFDGATDLGGATREITAIANTVNSGFGSGAIFTGVISNGGITKSGSGIMTLSNNGNTFTGPTTVNAGNLAVSTGALANSSSVTLANSGAVISLGLNGETAVNNFTGVSGSAVRTDFTISGTAGTRILGVNQTTDGTFAGSFFEGGSRPIALVKTGSAMLTLTGTGTYTGTTTVSEGTLKIGGAGLLGAGTYAGSITNDATLHFDSTATQTLAGTLSGSGALLKSNTGTVILTNNSSYEGALTISGGTFQIGNSTTAGFLGNASAITNNASLVFHRSNDSNVGNDISGDGTLTKLGAGTLSLNGASTYTGATTVSAGTLLVNGSLGNTAVSVTAGATIGGTGSLGGGLALDGGALLNVVDLTDPLAVTGAITFGSGFGIANLTGINWDILDLDTPYSVLATTQTFGTGDIGNFGIANAASVGTGRSAYFDNGSLAVIVIPEPSAALLGSLGMLALLRRRRA